MGYNQPVAVSSASRGQSGRGRHPRRKGPVRIIKIALAWASVIGMLIMIIGGAVWFKYLQTAQAMMPHIEVILDQIRKPPSKIVSADGVTLYVDSAHLREPVSITEVPQYVQDAIIAAEDKRFYEHSGVDVIGLARSFFLDAREGRFAAGGSTLAMQLAKRVSSNGQKTLPRKLTDMALAYEFEQTWSKKRILQLYLNQVYFGEGAYGIKAAAQVYFNKPLSKLTIAEAAMLARCVRRPSAQNPFVDLDASIRNRNVVLGVMREQGMITPQQYKAAVKERVHLSKEKRSGAAQILKAPYFVQQVIAELHSQRPDINLSDGGYEVDTTLNAHLQDVAEQAAADIVAKYADDKVKTAAFVLTDTSGKILAEVGGVDYAKSKFNIVTQGRRQPGSSFKPIVYATAFAEGKLNEDDQISDERFYYTDPRTHVVWAPKNDDGRYGGSVSVHEAMAQSINVAAARTMMLAGVDNVVDYAHNIFGITSKLPHFPSLALGTCSVSPLEMDSAYSVFMNRGDRATPYCIVKVTDDSGDTVFRESPTIAQNVLDPGVCDQINDLLRGVVTGGTGWKADVVPDARGKTGTTSDAKDAWFCGFAHGYLGVGWVGNQYYDKKSKTFVIAPMGRSVFGGTVTAEMWAKIVGAAVAGDNGGQSAPAPAHTDGSTTPRKHPAKVVPPPKKVPSEVKVVSPPPATDTTGDGSGGTQPPTDASTGGTADTTGDGTTTGGATDTGTTGTTGATNGGNQGTTAKVGPDTGT